MRTALGAMAAAVVCIASVVAVGDLVAVTLPGGSTAAGVEAAKPATKPADVKNTALGRLAASLKPGEMKELKTGGYNSHLLNSWYDWDHKANGGKGDRIYGAQRMFNIITGGWANDGKWDPVTRQVLYLGIGHYAALKFVTYSADTNAWTLMPVPTWCDPRDPKSVACRTQKGKRIWPRSHTYDSQFIDPKKRLFGILWRPRIYTYNIDTKKWSWHRVRSANMKNANMPTEYFPEMGKVLHIGSGNSLFSCDPETGKEQGLGKVSIGIHGTMEYNPIYKVMLVGGGSGGKGGEGNRNVSLVDGKGKITELKPLPELLLCTPRAKLMCDPVSGEYIIQGCPIWKSKVKPKVYALHPVRNEWKEIPGMNFPSGVAIPINTYGVIMICTKRKVFVYKHKPVWPQGKAK
jgi:hypothetical protein